MLDEAHAGGRGAGRRRGMPRCWCSGPQWHPGVVGIVAGRIKERFNRPACVAGVADGLAKGSGRSVAGLDLGAAVIAARQVGYSDDRRRPSDGGRVFARAGAAGRVPRLPRRTAGRGGAAALGGRSGGGGHARGAGRTTELAQQLARLAPFGTGNEEPMLVLQRARVVAGRPGRPRGRTAIRAFVEGEGGGPRLKAMLFRAPRRRAGRGAAGARRRAAASGRASARRGMERHGIGELHHRRRGAGLTLRSACPLPTAALGYPALRPVRLEAQDTTLSRR